MKTSSTTILAFTLLTAVFAACSRQETPKASGSKIYEVRGLVRGVEPADSTLLVEHEEIPGLMPSMTMPFTAREARDLERLKTGEAVAFRYVVTDKDSWIEEVKPIDVALVNLPAKKATPPAASSGSERLEEGDALPDFQLVDQAGRPVDAASFRGRTTVLTFIFTRCAAPKFCPLMTSNFVELEKKIKQDASLAAETRLLSISFDPEHDTPEVLAGYAAVHTRDGDFWRFATGQPAEVEKLTTAFSVYTRDERGTIDHGLCTALVDVNGIVRRIWRGNGWSPGEVLEALREYTGPPSDAPTTRDTTIDP